MLHKTYLRRKKNSPFCLRILRDFGHRGITIISCCCRRATCQDGGDGDTAAVASFFVCQASTSSAKCEITRANFAPKRELLIKFVTMNKESDAAMIGNKQSGRVFIVDECVYNQLDVSLLITWIKKNVCTTLFAGFLKVLIAEMVCYAE